MAQKNQYGTGCLAFFITIIVTVIGTVILSGFIGFNPTLIFIGVLTLVNFLVNVFFKSASKTSSFKKGKYTGIGLLVFAIAGFYYIFQNVNTTDIERLDTNENVVSVEYLTSGNDSIQVLSHHRDWNDYLGSTYSSKFTVRASDYKRLENQTSNFQYRGQKTFWGDLYRFLANNDTQSLDLMYNAFANIKRTNNLNSKQFVDMVVTMVQDIPYALVFEGQCLAPENYEEDFAQILRACPECCIGGKRFGIQNPVSFMGNLKGDCDTRTVLLYTILDHFGYDIAILNSDYYKHSILGINLPVTGTYKLYRGKKYYVWETTARNFSSGNLPATFRDINQWHIVLTNK